YWYEDPLADDDLLSYVKLKQHLTIPILATEYSPGGLTAYAPWLVHQATDFLRGDVAVKGGITALVKTAHLAEAFHMNYEVHHGGNSLNNVANLHVIMAIKNCEFFEVLLPAGAQKYGLAEDIEVDRQGLVHAFNGPGLGAAIDFPLVEKNKTARLASPPPPTHPPLPPPPRSASVPRPCPPLPVVGLARGRAAAAALPPSSAVDSPRTRRRGRVPRAVGALVQPGMPRDSVCRRPRLLQPGAARRADVGGA